MSDFQVFFFPSKLITVSPSLTTNIAKAVLTAIQPPPNRKQYSTRHQADYKCHHSPIISQVFCNTFDQYHFTRNQHIPHALTERTKCGDRSAHIPGGHTQALTKQIQNSNAEKKRKSKQCAHHTVRNIQSPTAHGSIRKSNPTIILTIYNGTSP